MTSPQRYPIPASRHRIEEEINRSRFITTVSHAPTVEDARSFIDEMRSEFADATHNCWAYLVGPPHSSSQIGYSDDGEPHGTAGKPMFTVLEHSGLGDIAVVVTRYFGGTKLGKGGLVRAYSGGVNLALAELPTALHIPKTELIVVCEYGFVTPIQRLLPDYEAAIINQTFAADVTFRMRLPAERAEDFRQALVGLTNGQIIIEPESGEATA
ncbi:MAG: YigZ family protein [Caldilineales bacterium]|nr:YigZ family protein [Caldilineales bacterium]